MKTEEDTRLINLKVELEKKRNSIQNKWVQRDIKVLENKIANIIGKKKQKEVSK